MWYAVFLSVLLQATMVQSVDLRTVWERWLHPMTKPVTSNTSSDVPSAIPSDTPSFLPSDVPSSLPSDVPSSFFSDVPSTFPSSIPTTMSQNVINEDAVQQGLESLDLEGFSDIQGWGQTGTLTDYGRQIPFSLENVVPYTDLFAPESYLISADGLLVTHILSNETFDTPIFRSLQEDGTIIQIAATDLGNISFAEIRVPDPTLYNDTFFLPSEFLRDTIIGEDGITDPFKDQEILLSFTFKDLDDAKLSSAFDLEELEVPESNRQRGLSKNRRTAGSSSFAAGACDRYQIVKVAVVYDADLCSTYGSMSATRNRIISIVASASIAYEREMCVKLQLNSVYTPDSTCRSGSSFTNNFYTPSACRGDRNLLDDFSDWVLPRRNSLGIDGSALIHLFTGADKVTSTIGCAWTSGYCKTAYAYGVEYATFSSNILAQSIVFAHEVGHNVGAPHVTDSSNRFNYIMEASISSGSDGFGPSSSNTILSYLAGTSCDTTQPSSGGSPVSAPRPSSPTSPRASPVASPTRVTSPTSSGECQLTAEVDAPKCISVGNISPGFSCYSLSEILPPKCTEKNARWILASCDGIALSRRRTNSFISASSPSCNSSCIRSTRNRICLRASSTLDEHVLKLVAVDRDSGRRIDGFPTLERIIPVQKNNPNGTCRPANLQCLVD